MGAFTPFKRNANKFNYTPRYYDPAKEAREQRRAEIRGERLDDTAESYQPGKYIRRSSAARAARRGDKGGSMLQKKMRMWVMIGAIIAVTLLGSALYNKLIEVLVGSPSSTSQTEVVEEEFNPYAPITVVPNDYEE